MASRRSQQRHKRAHQALAVTWVLFAIPTMLWWSDSILLVLAISIYANFVGHISAAEAADGSECERDCCTR